MYSPSPAVSQCSLHPGTNPLPASNWAIRLPSFELGLIPPLQTALEGMTQDWRVHHDRGCDAVAWCRAVARAPIASPIRPRLQALPTPSEEAFAKLARAWRRETAAMSSVASMAMHPAYQRIIGMGRDALPLIFRELSRQPGHWFWALAAITGENPVPPEEAGDVRTMRERWLQFARERGYL